MKSNCDMNTKWDKAMSELAEKFLWIPGCENEQVLRERLEPLLDRAEAVVAAHDPKHPHSVEWNLAEELSKWAR